MENPFNPLRGTEERLFIAAIRFENFSGAFATITSPVVTILRTKQTL